MASNNNMCACVANDPAEAFLAGQMTAQEMLAEMAEQYAESQRDSGSLADEAHEALLFEERAANKLLARMARDGGL